jgi:hypothetical protein
MAKADDIVKLFKKENFPTAVLCTIIIAPLMYVVLGWHYGGIIDTYKAEVETLTNAKAIDQQTIKQLNETKTILKNGITTGESDIVWQKLKSN